jgi:hypothetical protein
MVLLDAALHLVYELSYRCLAPSAARLAQIMVPTWVHCAALLSTSLVLIESLTAARNRFVPQRA